MSLFHFIEIYSVLVLAKQEINQTKDKENEKLTTNKPKKNKNKPNYIYKSK